MKKRFPLIGLLALSLMLLTGGCGSPSRYAAASAPQTAAGSVNYDMGFDNYSNGAWESARPAAAPVPVPYAAETAAETAAATEEIKMEMDTAMPEEGAAIDASSLDTPTVTSPTVPLERKLIRTMELTVETMDFDPLIEALQKKTAEFQGYIEQSDISGNSITNQGRPSKRYAHMVLRIPADRLDSFISQVEAAGNITYKSENVSDVTLQYSDVQSRLKTLRMEQERLWELLAKAESTESIVLLEERLTEVSSEIESCESRMRYLDNSVTYSTIYLDINEVTTESPTQPETAWQQIKRGFTRNLITLMDSLTIFFINLLSSLPVLLFLALLVFIAVRIIRRIRKHKKPRQPKPAKNFPGRTDAPPVQEPSVSEPPAQQVSASDTSENEPKTKDKEEA